MGGIGNIKRPPPPPQPGPQKPIDLGKISGHAEIREIMSRGQQPGVVGNKNFVETAAGRKIRLENRRKLERALHLNQTRSRFRARGIQGTQVRRKPAEAEGRLRKPGGDLRVSKPSLLGG